MLLTSPNWQPAILRQNQEVDSIAVRDALEDRSGTVTDAMISAGCAVVQGLCKSAEDFDKLLGPVSQQSPGMVTLSSPRIPVGAATYTSTEYSSKRSIALHQELVYLDHWPKYCVFFCDTPPAHGGATTLADLKTASNALPPSLINEFYERGVRYRMRFQRGVEPNWQSAFGTVDIQKAQQLAFDAGLNFKNSNGSVTLEFSAQGATVSPDGSLLWANQSHLFHYAGLDGRNAQVLTDAIGLDNLPRHCTFGDGQAIPDDMIAEVRRTFAANEFKHNWQQGDLLIIDNRRVMHGRQFFSGARNILAAFVGVAHAKIN